MTPPAVAAENTKAAAKPLWRPDESFWQRHSPHHEFPLATVTAITLCGLAVGFLFLMWILAFGGDYEADAPVRVDAAEIPGPEGGGGGYDGLGTGQSPLGAKSKTEAVDRVANPRAVPSDPTKVAATLPDEIKANPFSPATPLDFTPAPAEENPLASLQNDAQRAALEDKIAAEKAAALKASRGVGGPPGGKNTSGAGGGTGGGYGTGSGNKSGPGGGSRAGRAPTIQEVHANRWQFNLSGEAEHVQKLIAMGVTVILASPDGRYYQVGDLRKRPLDLAPVNPAKNKDEVTWTNRDLASLRRLQQALNLRFVPLMAVIRMPPEREQKLAAVERDAMDRQGRREETVRFTHFDFHLQNGVYEPYVTRIE